MTTLATTWGSKGQCVAPHDGREDCLFIPKGTRCSVQQVSTGKSRNWTTRRNLQFKMRRPRRGKYQFRAAGFELIVAQWDVRIGRARRSELDD